MNARDAKRRVYGGRSSDERRAERRERLHGAALCLFGTQGYACTSIAQLCTAAGVTARHFYEEFAEREALLVAVYDRIIEQARRAVLAALSRAGAEPGSRASAGIEAFVNSYLEDARFVRIACIEVVGVSPALERHRRAVIRQFARIIAAQAELLAAHGVLSPRDFSLVGIALAGATNELLIEWALAQTPIAPSAISEELVSLFLAAAASGAASESKSARI